jgi:hypothetical protein
MLYQLSYVREATIVAALRGGRLPPISAGFPAATSLL